MLTLFTNLNKKLNEFAKYVKQQSRSRLSKDKKNDTKRLYDSVTYNTSVTEDNATVGFIMAEYGAYVDQGVHGTDSSYISAAGSDFRYKQSSNLMGFEMATGTFAKWAKRKNFRFRNEKGQFEKGKYKQIGIAIALSIKKKGLKGNKFFTRSLEAGLDKYKTEFEDSIEMDIQEYLNLEE
tara:strand:+ start:289 stop:828 length:540 start_codon:yes stop_codon:yes gene_type:complete